MITDYIQAALRRAEYKKLADGTWFAEISGFDGVWANGQTVEACRSELIEVLEDWVLLGGSKGVGSLRLRTPDPFWILGIELGITVPPAE